MIDVITEIMLCNFCLRLIKIDCVMKFTKKLEKKFLFMEIQLMFSLSLDLGIKLVNLCLFIEILTENICFHSSRQSFFPEIYTKGNLSTALQLGSIHLPLMFFFYDRIYSSQAFKDLTLLRCRNNAVKK